MNRWWDDAHTARTVLEQVDDRDVVQGVGTAVLAYHAIAKAAIAPLSGKTLVDSALVLDALSVVDTELVAKALSAATEPIMGDASSKYGELLAGQIHSDAVAAVEQALRVWTSNGVPMPMAVERAADIVGVPVSRLGRYINAVKPVTVAPIVRMDAADRALMEFASHIGNRENVADTGAVEKAVRFREDDHPRDNDGKFATKQSQLEDQERLARIARKGRRDRRDRRDSRNKESANAEAKESTGPRTLADVAALLSPQRVLSERKLADRVLADRQLAPRQLSAATTNDVKTKRNAAPNRATQEVESNPKPALAPFDIKHQMKPHIALIPYSFVDRVVESGETLSLPALLSYAGENTVFKPLEMAEADPNFWKMSQHLSDEPMAAIIISGTVPVRDGTPDTNEGIEVPAEAAFRATRGGEDQIVFKPNGPEGLFPNSIAAFHFTYDSKETLSKNLERWRVGGEDIERDVARDSDGKFSDLESQNRKERMARRARRHRRDDRDTRNISLNAGEVKASPSLADVAQMLRGNDEQRELQPRTLAPRKLADRSLAPRSLVKPDNQSKTDKKSSGLLNDANNVLAFGKARGLRMSEEDFQIITDMTIGQAAGEWTRIKVPATTDGFRDYRSTILASTKTGNISTLFNEYVNTGSNSIGLLDNSVASYPFDQMYPEDIADAERAAVDTAELFNRELFKQTEGGVRSEGFAVRRTRHSFEVVAAEYNLDNPEVFITGDIGALNDLDANKPVEVMVIPAEDAREGLKKAFNLPDSAVEGLNIPATIVIIRQVEY